MALRRRAHGNLARTNIAYARAFWPDGCTKSALEALRELTTGFSLSVLLGEVRLISGNWYVTHCGLLRLAQRRHCQGIRVQVIQPLSDASAGRWVFRATVYKSPGSQGFVGYGDADPSNVSPLVRGAEMRVAETRAVNRALRKAYGIGLCSVEELGWLSGPTTSAAGPGQPNGSHSPNGSNNRQPRLRDQLCLLIRHYNLDPALVKAYAAGFCGTETLKEASRDLVEAFISQLAAAAKEDRDGLLCKLNSYAKSMETRS
jgi:hypothetical protein